ncbi:MAG: hypothetical protein CBARDMAM_3368 [uncultured Caballeronia sp.]|nr:MAG: hypothetical protein CBARDMAM_3368 [uncultured Caballeronia sp.]
MVDKLARRYYVEFCAAMAAYVVVLMASLWVLIRYDVPDQWRWAIAILPMVPMIFIAIAVLRQLRRVDELQRRIQFEALAIAFGSTALTTFGYGFLENVGFPKLPTFAIWPIMGALWIIGLRVVRIRYR